MDAFETDLTALGIKRGSLGGMGGAGGAENTYLIDTGGLIDAGNDMDGGAGRPESSIDLDSEFSAADDGPSSN